MAKIIYVGIKTFKNSANNEIRISIFFLV